MPGCPFAFDTLERVELRLKADQGHWIPCKRTVVPPREHMLTTDASPAWSQEEECRGARDWRARFLNERRGAVEPRDSARQTLALGRRDLVQLALAALPRRKGCRTTRARSPPKARSRTTSATSACNFGLDPYDFIGHRFTVEGYSFEWDEDDAAYLAWGIEEIRSYPGEFYGEYQVDLSKWLGPDQFGTLDRAVAGPSSSSSATSSGASAGTPVRNKQLMLYALGFWWNVARHITEATEFLIIIDQPRCSGGGGQWRTTLEELLAFAEEARAAAERTRDPNAVRTASTRGCMWCLRRDAPAAARRSTPSCSRSSAKSSTNSTRKFSSEAQWNCRPC
jgi:hypothetical protein